MCVLAYTLPLVFTWLLIHYTEHSTWLTDGETGREKERETAREREGEKERERKSGVWGGETQTDFLQGFPFCGISVNGQGNEHCGGIIVIDGH